MKEALAYLSQNYDRFVDDLRKLVAIRSISTDGRHAKELEASARLVARQMRAAGLRNVEILRQDDSYPYIYGEWLGAPGKPTVFLYSHHDVQPVAGFESEWQSDPWTLTRRNGRLYGRGSADDKAAITAQLASIESWLKTTGKLPVNVKVLVEGEEEVGSRTLLGFLRKHRERLRSDVIVVNDTENLETGLPSITYSLRGIVTALVQVEGIKQPVHSGMAGGLVPDAAIALNVILSRLFWKNGKVPIRGFYDRVRPVTPRERARFNKLPRSEARLRRDLGMPPRLDFANIRGVGYYEQTWRYPAVTVIALEASSILNSSNQVLPKASAVVSVRIVPDQKPEEVFAQLRAFLTKDPPWGVRVKVTMFGKPVSWWMTEPTGPAFEAALKAMQAAYKKEAVAIGCGGTIGFVGPLSDLFGGAPALLIGIEDPKSAAHAPNESLHEGDFRKVMASLVHLYQNLADLPGGKVR